VRASLYIGGVWIRQPKELNMKRLLGLLLVMGMVGCGGGDDAPIPNHSQAKIEESPDQYLDEDPLVALKKLGAKIERNSDGEVVTVDLINNTQVTDAGRLRTAEAVSGFVGHHVKTRGKIGDASC